MKVPWILQLSLSNDSPWKAYPREDKGRRICACVTRKIYTSIYRRCSNGIFDPRLSLTFMHEVMHPQRQRRKKSTKTWNFEVPLVDTHFTTPKMPFFHDLGQKWWPKVEALFGASMENEEEESYVREGEKRLLNFFLLAEWGERTAFWF